MAWSFKTSRIFLLSHASSYLFHRSTFISKSLPLVHLLIEKLQLQGKFTNIRTNIRQMLFSAGPHTFYQPILTRIPNLPVTSRIYWSISVLIRVQFKRYSILCVRPYQLSTAAIHNISDLPAEKQGNRVGKDPGAISSSKTGVSSCNMIRTDRSRGRQLQIPPGYNWKK